MHGILNIAKPPGCTSREIVNRIERRIQPIKVGHAGTLDPLATGVLVCPVGQGTRLIEYIQRYPKTYEGTFELGKSSDTEDITGTVTILENCPKPSRQQLEQVLPRFVGRIQQMPPNFSALKVKGQRAYKLARAGEAVELAARPIEVYSLELLDFGYPQFCLRITCGSGTYVRSLGRDIAQVLGSEAVMSQLVRTAIGPFSLATAISGETLAEADLAACLLPLSTATQLIPQVAISPDAARGFVQGQLVALPGVEPCEEVAALDEAGNLLAIVSPAEEGKWRTAKNFQAAMERYP
ncbi:MAG: tRNA pseudouridine(55) synthase TruB [Pirellulaceae bacterium]